MDSELVQVLMASSLCFVFELAYFLFVCLFSAILCFQAGSARALFWHSGLVFNLESSVISYPIRKGNLRWISEKNTIYIIVPLSYLSHLHDCFWLASTPRLERVGKGPQ